MNSIPRLHLISDSRLCPLDRFAALSRVVACAGVSAVHLREKMLPAGELLAAAVVLREALGGSATLFINDRIDLALLSDAGGVQLGEGSLPVSGARTLLPPGVLIGRSV